MKYILCSKVILMVLFVTGIFLVAPDANAEFFGKGILVSENILDGASVDDVASFKIIATIPNNTVVNVQFSPDRINYYSSTGVKGGFDSCVNGETMIDISSLSWGDSAVLFYKLTLKTTDAAVKPIVEEVEVIYNGSPVPPVGTERYPYKGALVSTDILSGTNLAFSSVANYFAYEISSLPYGTGVSVQFSRDGTNWYDSSGTLWGADVLSSGSHLDENNALDLANLNWVGAENFYYKLNMSTSGSGQAPIVNQAGLLVVAISVAWYNLEESFGNIAHTGDLTGSGGDGILYSGSLGTNTSPAAMWSKEGRKGGSLEFDGTDDNLKISIFQFPNAEQLSISQAVNFQTLETAKPIFSQWGNNNNNILIKSDDINSDELRICIAGSLADDCTNYAYTTDADLVAGEWYDIQVIYDGEQSSNDTRLRVYINEKQKTLSFSGTIPTTLQNPLATVEIGGDNDLGTYLHGKIDEIKTFNSVLSENKLYLIGNGGSPVMMGYDSSRNNNGIRVTGAAKEYCIPGDTAKCDSPIGEWKMDEMVKGNAKTLSDASGKGNDGTTYYGANLTGMDCTIPGKFGAGCRFDGVDDYASKSDNSTLESAYITVSCWLYINSHKQYNGVVGRWNETGSNRVWAISGFSDGVLHWYTSTNGGTTSSDWDQIGVAFPLNSWVYVTGVFDGDYMRLYLNGKEAVKKDVSFSTLYTGSTANLRIGSLEQFANQAGNYLNGRVDDVKIYNYARTPAQIAWDYNRGKPIAHWKFNEGENLIAHDESGNGKNGTLVNMTPATDWVVGKNDKALDFDGIDDYVQAGTNPIVGSAPFSISNWVKAGNHSDYGLALSIGNAIGSQAAWLGWVLNANVGSSNSLGGGFYGRNYGTGINDNNWHHLMLTFSGGTNGTAILYIDGVPKVTDIYTPNLQSTAISMGKANSGITYQYKGLIDDTKIFNYALTPEQVKQDYVGGSVIFE
ncbi:MAG: LamG-like jellyroll fold domain-containing protein [Candidatus Moraniibacteriota bacterium]